jgi:CBS domain-containing protein
MDIKNQPLGALGMALLSILVGVIAGLGAVAFRGLIGLFHNLLFLGKLSVFYDANAHTPASPWFLVQDSNEVIGVVTKEVLAIEVLHSSAGTLTMGQIANQAYVTVEEDMRLFDAMARMRVQGASAALVISGQGDRLLDRIKGVIIKEKIADSLSEAIDLFAD